MNRLLPLFPALLLVSASALAAEQEHDARKLDGVSVSAINAAVNVVFTDEPTVRVTVDGDEWPESVHVNQVGGTLRVNTGGKNAGVNIHVDECGGDDCVDGRDAKVIMLKHHGDAPIELDIDDLDVSGDARAIVIERFADGDGDADVREWVDEDGNKHIIVKREGEDGKKEVRVVIAKDGEGKDVDVEVIDLSGDESVIVEDDEDKKKNKRKRRKMFIKRRHKDDEHHDASVISDHHVEVRVAVQKGHKDEVPSLTLHLPNDLDLEVTTVNGGLDVGAGGKGPAKLATVNGRLSVSDFDGKLTTSTVAGAIDLQKVEGDVSARSVSGAVNLKGVTGEIEARTVSGAIRLSDLGVDDLEARSASGTIEHRGALSSDGKYSLKTTSGQITFELPADAAFSYEIDTLNGKIAGRDFGIPSSSGRMVGTVGQAGRRAPKLTIKSLSGQVRFVKE